MPLNSTTPPGNEGAVDEMLVRVQQLETELAAFAAEIVEIEGGSESNAEEEEQDAMELWDDSSEQEHGW